MAVIQPVCGKKERPVPAFGLLLVNPAEARTMREKLLCCDGRRQYLFNSELVVDDKREFFVAGPAVGAPAAVMALEKLVALGAQRVVLYGWCGAIASSLAIGDILVPDSARIGEGTSQYYGKKEESAPSPQLFLSLCQLFEKKDLTVNRGKVWSTDAIFREDREELLALHRQHRVVAVDMEFSALCSAAAFRNIEFAAVLLVSDLVAKEKWQPGFTSNLFRKKRAQVLDILLDAAVHLTV